MLNPSLQEDKLCIQFTLEELEDSKIFWEISSICRRMNPSVAAKSPCFSWLHHPRTHSWDGIQNDTARIERDPRLKTKSKKYVASIETVTSLNIDSSCNSRCLLVEVQKHALSAAAQAFHQGIFASKSSIAFSSLNLNPTTFTARQRVKFKEEVRAAGLEQRPGLVAGNRSEPGLR